MAKMRITLRKALPRDERRLLFSRFRKKLDLANFKRRDMDETLPQATCKWTSADEDEFILEGLTRSELERFEEFWLDSAINKIILSYNERE